MTRSKVVGDLQLGDKKVTLNHLVGEFRSIRGMFLSRFHVMILPSLLFEDQKTPLGGSPQDL